MQNSLTFLVGLIGSLILVAGAAWPSISAKKHPAKSLKNWLFGVGGYIMLSYAILGYAQGSGSLLFIFLQAFVGISTIMMLLNVNSRISLPILITTGLVFVIWSATIAQDYSTIFFITGLTGIAIGYALKTESVWRETSLVIGSTLIALFSYLGSSWIFFWLNVFFAIFATYHATKIFLQKH